MVRAFKRQFGHDADTGASSLAVRPLRPQGHHLWWRSKGKSRTPSQGPGFLLCGEAGYLAIR